MLLARTQLENNFRLLSGLVACNLLEVNVQWSLDVQHEACMASVLQCVRIACYLVTYLK